MPTPSLSPPLVIINYKVYPSTLGTKAVELTKQLASAAASYPEATVAVCPSHAELGLLAGATELPVLAQTVWGDAPGSGTGKVLVESLADLGVAGSLINHAECQVSLAHATAAVDRLDQAGLASIVCAADEAATRELAALGPGFLAVEPPALIGGETSVTSADPQIVSDSVRAAAEVDESVQVLCGAGVKTGEDVAKALALGSKGVLVASGVAKAEDPGAALTDLLEGTQG